MHSPKSDSSVLSPDPEASGQPSPPESRPRKKKSPRTSSGPNPNPLMTGSASSEATKSLLESGNGSSSASKRNKGSLTVQDKEKRAQGALRRLGVKREELARCPAISPILKKARGGLRALLSAMRLAADDPDIGKFLEAYDGIPPSDLPHLTWEAICLSAEVNPKHLLGAVQVAAVSFFSNTSRLIAVSSHPAITKARVQYALMPSGEKDRNALDIMVGALPTAKGPTFIGKAVFGGGGGSDKDDDGEDAHVEAQTVSTFGPDDDIFDIFPPANEIQEKIIPVRQRLTSGGK